MKKVIGIGNALTDILVNLPSDELLRRMELPRGSMSLVEAETQLAISKHTADLPRALSLGGSAGNTIRAMASLGVPTGFIGKVGADTTGDFYERALENLGVRPTILRGQEHSGRCISLISPDGERTMATFLGAAVEMSAEEIRGEFFAGYDYLYLEGYLVQNHDLIRNIAIQAKQFGLEVAIDLSSFNVVNENIDFLHALVADYVDIVFANQDEATAFTGESDPLKAAELIAGKCRMAVVKIGTRGTYIKLTYDPVVHVGIMSAASRVDTTGAGDFYAAGFMYGLCNGLSIRQCGTIGAIAAGKVIEVVGTTFGQDAWNEIAILIKHVKTEQYLF
ncbi:MAG: adenosine kinase [Rikenellaceae bacterium]|jgi:sugar/nucleoside kinase (ribokinase family)|nr:adenosine kinase [Rikenellaceae bacterium]